MVREGNNHQVETIPNGHVSDIQVHVIEFCYIILLAFFWGGGGGPYHNFVIF